LSTKTWSGVGRMATLLDYANVNLYIVSNEEKRFKQALNVYNDFQSRYRYVPTDLVGELYSAELNLMNLRTLVGL